jgi:hypothetical protein
MKKLILSIAIISLAISGANAQKFKPAPGFLKGQSEINVIFDYSRTEFDGDSQKEHYKDKGESWVEEWEGKRRENNFNSFISSSNDELKKVGVKVGEFSEAEYTFIVEVLDCDFGAFSAGFLPAVPAKVKATIKVVKTGTTEVIASITLKESQNSYTTVGTSVDFDRIYLAFGELGEELGEKLVKVLKK